LFVVAFVFELAPQAGAPTDDLKSPLLLLDEEGPPNGLDFASLELLLFPPPKAFPEGAELAEPPPNTFVFALLFVLLFVLLLLLLLFEPKALEEDDDPNAFCVVVFC
jgi:hypothetical protein